MRVAYVWSENLQSVADDLPANIGRSSLVHELVKAFDLVGDGGATIVPPDMTLGTPERLRQYHDAEYVDYLMSGHDDSSSEEEQGGPRKKRKAVHGLEDDCPHFLTLPRYASTVAAATSTACRLVASDEYVVAICWDGGRHHALRNRASGFCYIADIVLGISLLRKEGRRDGKRDRIMYIDLDLHYGDGVALAFHSPAVFGTNGRTSRAPQVLTMSVHHSAPGFFPPNSKLSRLPDPDTPHPFSLSVPLEAYASVETYESVWRSVEDVQSAFDPDYIVLQLGADGLPNDSVGRFGAWGVEGIGGMEWCVKQVMKWNKKVVVLGGGGYDHANTARAWCRITAALLGRELLNDTDIPHHDKFPAYAPSFTLDIPTSNAKDENSADYLLQIEDTFAAIANRIRSIK